MTEKLWVEVVFLNRLELEAASYRVGSVRLPSPAALRRLCITCTFLSPDLESHKQSYCFYTVLYSLDCFGMSLLSCLKLC